MPLILGPTEVGFVAQRTLARRFEARDAEQGQSSLNRYPQRQGRRTSLDDGEIVRLIAKEVKERRDV